MHNKITGIILAAGLCTAGMFACTRKWDDYNAKGDANTAKENLFEVISRKSELSVFTGYLKSTGYADTLALSKSYTVWAPSNTALATLSADIVNDPAKLKQFVAHHIGIKTYLTGDVVAAPVRLPVLDGKYVTFYQQTFEGGAVDAANIMAANGVLHITGTAAAPLPNCWDYMDSLKGSNAMAYYLRSLVNRVFDTSVAIKTGVDPYTGKIIYDTPSGMVNVNSFLRQVYDLGQEEKQYTAFVVLNPVFDAARQKLNPYYKFSTADSTTIQTSWNTVKNLVVEGAYEEAQLPDTLTSKFGVRFPVKKAAIVGRYKTSNGFVYVLNEMNIPITNSVRPIVIEGENPSGFSADRPAAIKYRIRVNPNTGQTFRDLMAYDHQVTLFNVRYRATNVLSCKYKVYWVAANDYIAANFNQRLAMGSTASATFPYVTVTPNNYNEVYLGDYTISNYGNGILDMYLVCNTTVATSTNKDVIPLFLDYIRLEPVIE